MTTQPADFRPYPPVTLYMNRWGHLEMWSDRDKAASPHRPADVYVQIDTDIDAVLECLPPDERADVDAGRTVTTYFVTDEYFPEV